jgi:5-methylcytosine-specific restriction endonuclease McrA
MSVLALDVSGIPREWISYDEAILYHAKGQVAWSLGEVVARYRGGVQKTGEQSIIETTSIIAVDGHGLKGFRKVALTNKTLFGRDRFVCAYCGGHFNHNHLSRDHVVPRFKGGEDVWTNVVTSCKSCNSLKGHKTLKEAGLELLYVPYEPNHYENLILQKYNILADQMEYLLAGVPKHSRVLQH